MCGGSAPAAPDYTPLANTMQLTGDRLYELGQQQLAFGQKVYQENLPLYQQMIQSNIAGQQQAMDLARQSADERKKYSALEGEIIADTQRFNKDQAADLWAGRAGADVEKSMAFAKDSAMRNMSRYGVKLNPDRLASLSSQFAMQGALAKAGAMNNARLSAEQQGTQMKYAAAQMGRNLPGTMLSAIGTGAQVGGATSGLMNASTAPMYQGYNGAMGGMQGQMGALNGQANMMNMGYQNQMSAYNANQASDAGMGQLIGMGAMSFGPQLFAMSSEEYKKDKEQIKQGSALQALNNMDVERWNYKQGIADSGQHVGPYAEQFKRETGLGDGRVIPLQDAIGVTMKAVQDLDRKVTALGRANGGSVRGGKNADGRGGAIRGPGTGTSDSVKAINTSDDSPVLLSNGEYIIPADVVKKRGKEYFDRMVAQEHTPVGRKA